MHMQQQPQYPQNQKGAFLVIALILLIVLSAMGVAAMSIANTSERVSHNYSQYLAAQIKAISMAGYIHRILGTFVDGKYFGPGSCNSAATCNLIDSTFPMDGRPVLPWTTGAGMTEVVGSSESNSWWGTNAFAYEGTFAGSGSARGLVAFLGNNTSSPYQNTYRVTGYATDNNGIVKSTYQIFHVWNSYPADPGDGTCAGSCHYAQCCSDINVCGSTAAECNVSTATYVPPGWTCTDYFVTGLGFSGTVCANPIAPP